MQFFCNLFSFIFISKVKVIVVIVVVVVLVLKFKPMGAYWYQITRWTVTGKKTKYGRIKNIPFIYDLKNYEIKFEKVNESS